MLSRSPLARRGLLLGGVGAVAALAAGCGTKDAGAGAANEPTSPAVGADSDLVERVVGEIRTALGTASATARRHRALRGLARPFAALHRTHLDRLEADAEAEGSAPADEASARAALLRAEERLQRGLVGAAVEAQSGALAQVFAAMAAGVAQQREVAGG